MKNDLNPRERENCNSQSPAPNIWNNAISRRRFLKRTGGSVAALTLGHSWLVPRALAWTSKDLRINSDGDLLVDFDGEWKKYQTALTKQYWTGTAGSILKLKVSLETGILKSGDKEAILFNPPNEIDFKNHTYTYHEYLIEPKDALVAGPSNHFTADAIPTGYTLIPADPLKQIPAGGPVEYDGKYEISRYNWTCIALYKK